MTARSSEAATTHPTPPAPRGKRPRWQRRPRWPALLCGVLVVAAVAVAVAVAYDNGVFTRGPTVDAATAYIRDIQAQRYVAAYAQLAPDLRHDQTEQSFASRMRAIDAADGRIVNVAVASEQQGSDGTTVVQLTITRTSRGAFTAHVAVLQSGGAWLVTGADDL